MQSLLRLDIAQALKLSAAALQSLRAGGLLSALQQTAAEALRFRRVFQFEGPGSPSSLCFEEGVFLMTPGTHVHLIY